MKTTTYAGQDCCVLENAALELLVTRSVGPRLLSLRLRNGENLFAELPDFVAPCPGYGEFHFYGGHRLWYAPERLPHTYLPDDAPVEILSREDGLLCTQRPEAITGIEKSLQISLAGDAPQVLVRHTLTHRGTQEVTCAPWAITQLKTGGLAILPQAAAPADFLPNRSIALWPYTNMADLNATWGHHYLLVAARMVSPFKLGFPNPRGWLAYWLNGTLFVKVAPYQPAAAYGDLGSSSECYCNDRFLELETLGPLVLLHPGESVSHVEKWYLYENVAYPHHEEDVQSLVTALRLDELL